MVFYTCYERFGRYGAATTNRGELTTLVADKRRGLLMVGDDA